MPFPVIMNTTKRIAFENVYESSIIFQSYLYANILAESPSFAPTFFFTYTRHSWSLISENYFACHTYCATGHPFIRTRDTHICCRAISSGAVNTCFDEAMIRTSNRTLYTTAPPPRRMEIRSRQNLDFWVKD